MRHPFRLLYCLQGLGILLAMAILLAAPARAQSPEPSYGVGAGDVLSITVYGDEGLSGQFAVAPDGSIAYPILGNVPVSGLTPAEIGEHLHETLAEYIPGLTVTAAIARHAPVFVVGDVENPGQYEYRPGMIALELLALAGGARRALQGLDGLQLISARQEYADLTLQIFAREVRRARLQAELNGSDFAFTPPEDAEPLSELRRRAVDGERRLFEIRRATLASEVEALAAQEASYADEIESVTASIALHREEMELLRQDVAATKELADRALTARSNLREAERRLSAARRDALELASFLARAQQNQLAFRQRRLQLMETRRGEAASQIQEIELDLARMRTRQRSLLDAMAEAALGVEDRGNRDLRLSLSILRNASGEYQEVAVGERTGVRPGDILRARLGTTDEETASQGDIVGAARLSPDIRQLP